MWRPLSAALGRRRPGSCWWVRPSAHGAEITQAVSSKIETTGAARVGGKNDGTLPASADLPIASTDRVLLRDGNCENICGLSKVLASTSEVLRIKQWTCPYPYKYQQWPIASNNPSTVGDGKGRCILHYHFAII